MDFHKFTKLAAQPVPGDGRTIGATQHIAHSGAIEGGIEQHGAGQGTAPDMPPQPSDGLMGRPAGDATDQALMRWRPLARRDLSTARPARVAIRARNPCFLARRRELGWKVRFMAIPLGTSSRGSRHHEVCLSLRHPTDNFHRLTVRDRLHPPDFRGSWAGQ